MKGTTFTKFRVLFMLLFLSMAPAIQAQTYRYVHAKSLDGNGNFKESGSGHEIYMTFDGNIAYYKTGNLTLRYKYARTSGGDDIYNQIGHDYLSGRDVELDNGGDLVVSSDRSVINFVYWFRGNITTITVYEQKNKQSPGLRR